MSIRYLIQMKIWGLIVAFQVFSPAKVIFAGIGVLFLVGIIVDFLVWVILMA